MDSKIREYIQWFISKYDLFPDKIDSSIDIEKLKQQTFSWSIQDNDLYFENIRKIFQFQYETAANLEILLTTLFHLLSSFLKKGNNVYLDICVVQIFRYQSKYGFSKLPETFFDKSVNLNTEQFKLYSKLWSSVFDLYSQRYSLARSEEGYYPLDWRMITVFEEIYQLIGYEIGIELYKIANKKLWNLLFCILFPLKDKISYLISEHYQIIFSPYQFYNIKNHPLLSLKDNEIKTKLASYQKEFSRVSTFSKIFQQYLFDVAKYHILETTHLSEEKKLLSYIYTFMKKYNYIATYIQDNKTIKYVDDQEDKQMKYNYLFFDWRKSKLKADSLIRKTPIQNWKNVFHFFDKATKSLWYKNSSFSELDNTLWQQKLIFELARMFLYQKIGIEQFDRLHSIYLDSKKQSYIALLYNLILGKFCFAFLRIGTEYYTEGYNLLLKQMFKNFWLNSPWDGMEKFRIPKEYSNDFVGYLWESDDDVVEYIFLWEWLDIEFKASLCLDRKEKIKNNQMKKMELRSIFRPIVSFLNGLRPAKIVVGIREAHKVNEEISKGVFSIDNLSASWIKSHPKTNNHFLTWIENDIILLWNKTEDNFLQYIDSQIQKYINPNPLLSSSIKLSIKKFLWKKILIIDVIPSGDVFCLKEFKNKNNFENVIYVRYNWADKRIQDPLEIIKLGNMRTSTTKV